MVPPHLRNTSMESFMSTDFSVSVTNKTTGSVTSEVKQFSNRSCMGCHGEGGTDFSYVYLDAVTQRVPIK
jgi:transposase-like protein